jgi:tRNA (guanosine-2'-O-)-methyltransferase
VESFNISVAAALIMYEAQQQRIRQYGQAGDLTPQQQQQLLAAFLLRGVVSCGRLLAYSVLPDSASFELLEPTLI